MLSDACFDLLWCIQEESRELIQKFREDVIHYGGPGYPPVYVPALISQLLAAADKNLQGKDDRTVHDLVTLLVLALTTMIDLDRDPTAPESPSSPGWMAWKNTDGSPVPCPLCNPDAAMRAEPIAAPLPRRTLPRPVISDDTIERALREAKRNPN